MANVRQSDISANRDFVGRDQYNVHVPKNRQLEVLNKLFDDFQDDVEAQRTTSELVHHLQGYIPDDLMQLQRDLERKLVDAGRADLVKQATRYKEIFRQRLEKYRLFASAQKIYAILLGMVLSRFDGMVKPLIQEGCSKSALGQIIQNEIVEAVMELVPDSEPACDHPCILGMLYFLTGNCMIDWHD